jgi:hypothetical protein
MLEAYLDLPNHGASPQPNRIGVTIEEYEVATGPTVRQTFQNPNISYRENSTKSASDQ